jgi:hypothetical protein
MRRFLAVLGVILLTALPAQASLIGTQVNGAFVNPFPADLFAGNPQPATVTNPGVEFSFSGDGSAEADFDANSLTIRLIVADFLTSFSFFGFDATFDFLTPGLVTGVSVVPGGTVILDVLPVLTGDRLTFSTEGTVGTPGGTTLSVTLLLTTGDSTPVPAPGAIALFGAALLGLGVARTRRRR